MVIVPPPPGVFTRWNPSTQSLWSLTGNRFVFSSWKACRFPLVPVEKNDSQNSQPLQLFGRETNLLKGKNRNTLKYLNDGLEIRFCIDFAVYILHAIIIYRIQKDYSVWSHIKAMLPYLSRAACISLHAWPLTPPQIRLGLSGITNNTQP